MLEIKPGQEEAWENLKIEEDQRCDNCGFYLEDCECYHNEPDYEAMLERDPPRGWEP